jgi:hypothetical protein
VTLTPTPRIVDNRLIPNTSARVLVGGPGQKCLATARHDAEVAWLVRLTSLSPDLLARHAAKREGAMSNNDTFYYIKSAANPEHHCVVAGDRYDGKVYLQPHDKRTNAQWRFEAAEDGFYYIVDKSHGCALGTGFPGVNDRLPEAAVAQVMIHHWDKQKRSDWAQHCRWRVQPGKKPGSYILVNLFSFLSLEPNQAPLQVSAPRLSQLQSQWVLETAIEGENIPEFVATPEPVLDATFFKDIVQGRLGIDVNAASPRLELTAPETERHRFADKTPWLKHVTRDRSISSVYQKIPRNPGLRYEASGSVIENVVVENDSPNGVIPTPPAPVDMDHEYRGFFVYIPSKNAVALLPYTLMGPSPVGKPGTAPNSRIINRIIPLDSAKSSAVRLAAASAGICYVLHADGASPAKLSLANFVLKRITPIPLPGQYSLSSNKVIIESRSCEICWIPQQGELLLAVYGGNQCSFHRYSSSDQKWNQPARRIQFEDFTITSAALSPSGACYILDTTRGDLRRIEADGRISDLGGQPPGLLSLKVAPDGGVWGFFEFFSPRTGSPPPAADRSVGRPEPDAGDHQHFDLRQRICVLHEDAGGKASWHPVLEPKADGSKTPNGYDDKDKENNQGIACAPVSSTQALCWPLAPDKAKRPLYRLMVGAVDQPPLPFSTYTDEGEKKAYRFITDQLLESSGADLRSRYGRINPIEANNYLAELRGLKPADGINPEKFRAVRDDLACELTYLVFAKNLFDELHRYVLTNQMVNDHAMAAVAKAFDVPTDVNVEAGSSNPEATVQRLEIAETAVGGTSALVGAASSGLGYVALTTASFTMAAAATGIGAAVIGVVAIALAIAVAIEADKERKEASEPPTFKVTVNDTHYEINSTLAGIQERMDQIFVGILDQLEAWRKHVSEDLGALIVVGRLAKAQVWSAEDLVKVDHPGQPTEILRATQTSLKAYYQACVRTYGKALLRHFMMVAMVRSEDSDWVFTPRPTRTYPRYPFWAWHRNSKIDKSNVGELHTAPRTWGRATLRGVEVSDVYLMQKGERRDTNVTENWDDMGAPAGTDLLKFLIAHGATRDDIANNWNLVINDAMCVDWGHG